MSEIQLLLDRLASSEAAGAEAAMARLAVLGSRVVDRLVERLPGTPEPARSRMLRLMERIPDFRNLPVLATELRLGTPPARRLAARALGRLRGQRAEAVLRLALDAESDRDVRIDLVEQMGVAVLRGAAELLDPLLDILFDRREDAAVRRAAFGSLGSLPRRDARRLLTRLERNGDAELAAEAALHLVPTERHRRVGRASIPAVLKTLEQRPSDPTESFRHVSAQTLLMTPEARRLLAQQLQATWPPEVLDLALDSLDGVSERRVLSALKRLAVALADLGHREPDPDRARVLETLRARAHRLLAAAGSRLAVGDLKDALAACDPPPPDLVFALGAIGRADDLPDLLHLHTRADPWLQGEIGAAVVRIARREGRRRIRRLVADLPSGSAGLLGRLTSAAEAHGDRRGRAGAWS